MNKFIITNDAAENSSQVQALKFGNGSSLIYSKRVIQRASKGWSSKDRHKKKSQGGKKPDVGDLGEPFPGMLKFWSKREGMFMYRQFVRPIGADVVKDFNRAVDTAVSNGLDQAVAETFEMFEEEEERTSNDLEDMMGSPVESLEEWMHKDNSKISTDHADETYGEIKTQEEAQLRNVRISKQEFLTRVDDVHKTGQPKAHRPERVIPIPEPETPLEVVKNKVLGWFGLRKK